MPPVIDAPLRLLPTNLSGVFVKVPGPDVPADRFTVEMLLHPDLRARLRQINTPAGRSLRKKLLSRHWRPEDQIHPEFEPRTGITHLLSPSIRISETVIKTNQWSGGMVNGTWNGAAGAWRVPEVSRPSLPPGTSGGWDSASWVGIDGYYGSNDVLQAGVEQQVSSSGDASYFPWYEWYVVRPQNLPPGTPVDANGYPLDWVGPSGNFRYIYSVTISNMPVFPGDEVFCHAYYVNGRQGEVFFGNVERGNYFSVVLAPPPTASFNGNCVEWIMEAPNKGEPTTSLPAFTPVVFSTAVGTGPGNADANPANGDLANILASGKQLTSVALGSHSVEIDYLGGLQTGWRWCRKCNAIFAESPSGSGAGVCPADNGQHDGSTSRHYAAVIGEDGPGQQGGWRWCRKCSSLFAFGPGAVEGVCPADHQQHDASTSLDYAAIYGDDADGQQGGWRWCQNCASMFAAIGTDQGVCPATTSQQAGWRWCRKCLGMFADDASHGICPADSGPHDGSASLHYAALIGEDSDGQQGAWRWCRKCHGMFYSGGPNQGVCPADHGSHDGSSSLHYAIIHGPGAEGQQPGWKWCTKCQGLFASANPSDGKCAAGGPHDGNGSLPYVAVIGDGIGGHDGSRSQHYAMLLGD